MEAAAENLTPVILELGGKDPFIVFDDAEFPHVVDVALRSIIINCGQNCIAAERFYFQDGIYDKLVSAFLEGYKKIKQGTQDCGCMTMPAQLQIVEDLINDAVAKGAKIETGGKRNKELGNLYFEPTVLTNVDHTMRVMNEEAFGPIMPIYRFKTEEEVIKLGNATPYALSASVFSKDYKKAERVGKQLISGMLTINDWAVSYLIQALPFGGCKVSGFGKFNGPEGLRDYCNGKSVVSDRFPIRTTTPRFLKYPVPEAGPKIVSQAINLIYSRSIGERLMGGVRLVNLLILGK